MIIALFLLWIVLCGRVTIEIVLFGIALSAAVGLLAWQLPGCGFRRDLRAFRLVFYGLGYAFLLLREIIKANMTLVPIFFGAGDPVDPCVFTFDSRLRTNMARTLLANSITLTPGTVTLVQEGSLLTVHGLRPDMLESLPDGAFVWMLRRMEEAA